MTDYSKVSLKQISILMEILKNSSLREEQHIKAQYEQFAHNYEDTVSFLKSIDAVHADHPVLTMSPLFEKIPAGASENEQGRIDFQNVILWAVLSSRDSVRGEAADLMKSFRRVANGYEWRPDLFQRLRFSGIRNLLMELGLIRYDSASDMYRINEQRIPLVKDYVGGKPITPEVAANMRLENETLGSAAELEVIKYEEARLSGQRLPDSIKWVAKDDVTLGYDVYSFTVNGKDPRTFSDRFIEVKAVSGSNYRFFWSRNEIESAKLLADNYFLYLVPVIRQKEFDLEALLIIQDPYRAVLLENRVWSKSDELISCFKTDAKG